MTIDPLELRHAFGNFMTGVTVVTALDNGGAPIGFTANSFTSVSLTPPLLLVCPGTHLSSIDIFRECSSFAVNILAEDQEEISNTFAMSAADRFSGLQWKQGYDGVPVISGALASFCCTTHNRVEAGDHLILVGEVKEFTKNDGRGLGYWKGGYFKLGDERRAETTVGTRQEISVWAIVENSGRILALQTAEGYRLPSTNLPADTKASAGIQQHMASMGMVIEPGRIFSIFHEPESKRQFMYFRAMVEQAGTPAGAVYLSSEEAAEETWCLEFEATMVRRYFLERDNNAFGLYVGDALEGEIHDPN